MSVGNPSKYMELVLPYLSQKHVGKAGFLGTGSLLPSRTLFCNLQENYYRVDEAGWKNLFFKVNK